MSVDSMLDWMLAALLMVGGLFALIGSFGLVKLSDFYKRLHGPTKATTLGVSCILIASAVRFSIGEEGASLHEVLVTVFLFITAPVSAHLLAKAALKLDQGGIPARRAEGEGLDTPSRSSDRCD
jgi:multicomponent K+:H+ antiporter subunit G